MTRHIDWDKVDQLFITGSNITQACYVLGVCKDTLYKKCQEDKNKTLSTYYEEKEMLVTLQFTQRNTTKL